MREYETQPAAGTIAATTTASAAYVFADINYFMAIARSKPETNRMNY